MVAVLDQFEVEYKESYISGTYDQVVMGNIISLTTAGGKRKYVYGNRGVVYGSINSSQSQQPGTSVFDSSTSVSYRSQPYKEKSGNCRAAKHICHNERIYDTLTPDAITCFKRNGAEPFFMSGSVDEKPGFNPPNTGVDNTNNVGFIMFDNFIPTSNGSRSNFNRGVDKNWTRSFPFEPRYSDVSRKLQQKFFNGNIEAAYHANFLDNTGNNFTKVTKRKKIKSLIIGTVGPNASYSNKHNTLALNTIFLPSGQNWYHHWVVDRDTNKKFFTRFVTGSCSDNDTMKVLFGYGDVNTIMYSSSYVDSNNVFGYAMRGSNNWPEFRLKNNTNVSVSLAGTYEGVTGSIWNISPIIRGWKYGLHSALEDYTSAYYRQGRYGQFRDMLEQRKFTKIFAPNSQDRIQTIPSSPVTVKFVDSEGKLTIPENTQSQNLSFEATSSLPYFDLLSRNRPIQSSIKATNLKLINFSVDGFGNTRV